MTIPRLRTGDQVSDRFQLSTQTELTKLSKAIPQLELVSEGVTIPLDPATLEITIRRPFTAWFVVNRTEGGEVFEVERGPGRLVLSASTLAAEADIAVW